MRYIAKHYVSVSGRTYTPGEIIDVPIQEEKLPRLLKLGAVIPDPSELVQIAVPSADNGKDELEETRKNYAAQLHGLGYDESGNSLPDEAIHAEETAEEADEDAPAPEIDVMDGIVTEASAEGLPGGKPVMRTTAGVGAPEEEKPAKSKGGRRAKA